VQFTAVYMPLFGISSPAAGFQLGYLWPAFELLLRLTTVWILGSTVQKATRWGAVVSDC